MLRRLFVLRRAFKILPFDAVLGRTYRIVFDYQGALHAFLWLRMANDGSVSIGSYGRNKGLVKSGMLDPIKEGRVSVAFKDMVTEDVSDTPNPRKVTFHVSGAINISNKRRALPSLRTLDKPLHLYSYVFKHPSQMPRIEDKNKRDKQRLEEMARSGLPIFEYPFSESAPLQAHVILAPASKIQRVWIDNARYQFLLELRYGAHTIEHLEQSFVLQLYFFHGQALKEWPQYLLEYHAALRDDLVPEELRHKRAPS